MPLKAVLAAIIPVVITILGLPGTQSDTSIAKTSKQLVK